MSASGQKRTFSEVRAMSALPPKAGIGSTCQDVRFVPKADQVQCSKKSVLILATVLESQPSGLFQTRFERGKKASCFASSDGAMIKGER
jgi:hypothetical protein